MRSGWAIFLILPAMLSSAARADVHGYEFLADWTLLPADRTHLAAGLASSYDRSGANEDYNQYLSPPGLLNATQYNGIDVVVTELPGPGVLTRFWMPHAAANAAFPLRVYVDGVLRISTTSNTYLDGQFGYAASPLTATLIGGQFSYEPIAFQQSLRIESANYTSGSWERRHHYYQWNYCTLPAGSTVTPYTGTLTPAQQNARAAAVAMISQVGQNPAGPSATAEVISHGPQSLAAGAALVLCDRAGSGRIRRLNVKLPAGATDVQLDGLRLGVWYDGDTQPAIDVPVSHFFGAGHGRAAYRSLPLGTDSPDGFYCYWPMPFRQAVQVKLTNTAASAIDITSAAVEVEAGPVEASESYLHAVFHEQTTAAGQQHHQLLAAGGAGHYVGNLLYVQKPGDSRSILESDDIITVNPGSAGQRVLYGTGLEDAYNGGYYYNHVVEQNNDGETGDPTSGAGPFSGLLYMDFYDLPGFQRTRTDQYRWLIADAVPFTDGIDVRVENYLNTAGTLFGSVAFYYALPAPAVTNAHVFYNRSAYDGNDPAANAADDAAIAADKLPLRPGQASGPANVTGYSRGINGVMVDLTRPAGSGEIGPGDFVFEGSASGQPGTWTAAPAPSAIAVRSGAGEAGSDRVTIIWPDGAIQDCWLKIEVLATAGTGLAAPEEFIWGNLRGDVTADGNVNVFDLLTVQQNYLRPPTDPTRNDAADLTRDTQVNIFDLLLVRQRYLRTLPTIEAGQP